MTAKTAVHYLGIVIAMAGTSNTFATPGGVSTKAAAVAAVSQSAAFVENKGQWDAQASFLMSQPGLNFWVTQDGPVLDFYKTVAATSNSPKSASGNVVSMKFLGAQRTVISGAGALAGQFNYFFGNDESKWVTGAARYSEVDAEQIYQGIGVRYAVENGSPRYDMILKPGADVSQIAIKIEGAAGAKVLENGNLQIQTSLGAVEETGLAAYQQDGANRVQVPCRMQVAGNVLTFDVGGYDASKPLVIDPIFHSTYLGVTSQESGIQSVAIDTLNNVVVVGQTFGGTFPTSVGAYQTAPLGSTDAFITKLNPALTALVFSTYFGASHGSTYATSVVLDGANEPVVAGYTDASNLPVSTNAFEKTYRSTVLGTNAFVAKFKSTGAALIFSTYLGGAGSSFSSEGDEANCVKLDNLDQPVVVGYTASANFPTTTGAFQTTLKTTVAGPNAFVSKLNATGSALVFSTLLGGSGGYDFRTNTWLGDNANAVALDANEDPIVVGQTASPDFPISATAFQKVNLEYPNARAAFVTKLNPTGTALVYSTLLCGTGASDHGGRADAAYWAGDAPSDVVISSSQNAIVVGGTQSANFPVTAGAYQTVNRAAADAGPNGFITELNSTGSGLVFSTYFGGSFGDGISSIKFDASKNLTVAGATASPDFPVTAGAFQVKLKSLAENAFVAKFNPTASSLLYSSFLGGNYDDVATDLAFDSSGYAILVGITTSSDFPTTYGAYEPAFVPTNTEHLETGFISTVSFTPSASALENFEVAPNPVIGGDGVTGKVFLSNSSTSNIAVALSASSLTYLTMPSSVIVPASVSEADFSISTKGVAAATAVNIHASYNGTVFTQTLTIEPATFDFALLDPATVLGGNSSTVEVLLNGVAPTGGTPIHVTIAGPATAPATLSVPAGRIQTTFAVKTSKVTTTTTVTITVTIGTIVKKLFLTVEP